MGITDKSYSTDQANWPESNNEKLKRFLANREFIFVAAQRQKKDYQASDDDIYTELVMRLAAWVTWDTHYPKTKYISGFNA